MRILLIVPDFTRRYSGAGEIARDLCKKYVGEKIDLLVATGTHRPMTREEIAEMYGEIPLECFTQHNWRENLTKIGEIPAKFVREVSEGLLDKKIDVEINSQILADYDLIFSIGQVVPHEVAGMANHSKNIFVGCGGADMINSSHMLGAFYGMERVMGRIDTPVRRVFDCAAENFLTDLPLNYILTAADKIFAGQGRGAFEQAAAYSAEKNITLLQSPLRKVVVFLPENEFKSTWLGNKAIYRTRMAMADGGELVILAPGVERFGEDPTTDALIRKYGYIGREKIIRLFHENTDLQNNMSAAAHLIHGSSDGRFEITYCTRHLSAEEITRAGFRHMPYDQAAALYKPGGDFFYISNPALGLWASQVEFSKNIKL